MTTKPKEEEKYIQGYWVELEKARLAGGVSAEKRGVEVGLGAVLRENVLGITSYIQYGLTYLQGRWQLDLVPNENWTSQITVGIPITLSEFKLEPHLTFPIEEGFKAPKLGLRVQYQF